MKTIESIIKEVLKRSKSKKKKHVEDEWYNYLKEKLQFPFEAEVNLISYTEVFEDGDIIKVVDIDNFIDLYGFIMKVKKSRKTYYLPLLEMELTDKNSTNQLIIDAFFEWEEH
ncbi:MAG: calcium-binding protein [Bacteroidales bacterium]|nr:calcium-binding protein [Bacteroidales bacterium]